MTETAGHTGNGPTAVVIGAGMIGVCCALFLQRDGYSVTLIDRQGPGEGAARRWCRSRRRASSGGCLACCWIRWDR
jgi:glycine/D-amino acid oxidase-like deaminating enzyme